MADVHSVNISRAKGERKQPVSSAELKAGHGLVGDGHAGGWHRQVSLLALESIDKMRRRGIDVGPGDFAENLTTSGIDLLQLPLGSRLKVGGAILEVTQHGKECHDRCAIYRQAGDCVMPREGIFAVVVEGAVISRGDGIEVVSR
jgi:MOSC domain-containing protein YiiM